MEGKFVKKISPVLLGMFVLGTFALILTPIKLNQWPDVTGQLYTALMILWGLALAGFVAFWVGMLLANRGAYLRLEENGIRAQFGFGTHLECTLESLNYIAVGPAVLTLETGGKIYDIPGLENVGDIAGWLKKQLPFIVPQEDRQVLLAQRRENERKRKKWLIAMVCLGALMFINIGLVALATGKREMTAFTSRDFVCFYIFIAAELATVAGTFWCANRTGKCIRQLAVNHDKLRCRLMATVPLPEGDAIGVFYDGGGQRLTLFADPNDRIYYITQNLTKDYTLRVSGECEPTDDTTAIDRKIDEMRDIGFLFGME